MFEVHNVYLELGAKLVLAFLLISAYNSRVVACPAAVSPGLFDPLG